MHQSKILKKVKQDYSRIAEEFNVTRAFPWPEFDLFLRFLKLEPLAGSNIRLLDIGCGNGRLAAFLKNKSIEYIGIDNNKKLLKIAQKKHPGASFRYADGLKLPFLAASFDTVWCIAMLHHLPSKTLQLRALKGMRRVLKKNGSLMLTVWNLWQPKYKKYIDFKTRGALVPWGSDKKIKRYYYAFRASQLRELLTAAGFSTLKKVPGAHNIAYICL